MTRSLIGRDDEVARLDAALAALGERGGALVVLGDPGIGKSALLAGARQAAEERGARVLATVGVESEIELAFAGLHQLLAPVLDHAERLPDPRRRALEAAFGERDDLEPDRFHVALAAHQLICEAAPEAGLLVLVDDAHWLDRSSQNALAFVARRVQEEPVFLLAAQRSGQRTALAEQRLPTLRLARLSEVAAAELIDREAPRLHPIGRARVLAEAAGNPLALVELGDPEAGSPDRLTPRPRDLTDRLEVAFAERLAEVPEGTRLVLLAAALDGGASLEEVLAAAAAVGGGPTDGEAIGAGAPHGSARRDGAARPDLSVFDAAAAAGLVELRPGELRFRHPLMRSAVRQGAPPAQVIAMYAGLAEVVEDPERRLWHRAMAAVDGDEELAAELEAYAATVRGRGAVSTAGAALERAAALSVDPGRRGERQVRAAEVAYEVGLVEAASEMLAAAERVELSRVAAARLAWLRQMISGDVWTERGAARVIVEIAGELAAGGDPDAALRALFAIAHRSWWTRTRTRTREYVVAAADAVGVDGDDPRVLAVIALAHPEATGERVRRAAGHRRPHEVGDPAAALGLGSAIERTGDFVTALPFLDRAVEGLREQGRLGLLTQALVYRAWTALHTGDWPTAVRSGAEAATLARDTRQPQYGLVGEVMAALAAAHQGEEVEPLLEGPERVLVAADGGPLLAPVHLASGAAAMGEGRSEDALRHLWPLFDRESPVFHRFMRWSALLDLAEASGGSGLDAVFAELGEVAAASGSPYWGAALLCARAAAAEDEAVESLCAVALADPEVARYPFLRARVQFVRGRRLRRARRDVDARGPLREAIEAFDGLGAARWGERARQELRATGERIGPRTPVARDRLTAQELRIAELAAQGLSNREIGARLYLSHRTVGSHLYRAFPKLGITARAQLRDALTAAADAESVG